MPANDCAVQTFVELTGIAYDAALRVMRSAGYRPKDGTSERGILAALSANGYGARRVSLRVEDLPRYTAGGARRYLVVGWTEAECHAWSVTNGKANRAFPFVGFQYRAYEVLG